MSESITIARPYAKAAFDYALVNGVLDKWEEMLIYLAEIAKQPKVLLLLNNRFIDSNTVVSAVIDLCDNNLDQYGKNLVRIMAENHRLKHLPEVFSLFSLLKNNHEKIIEAQVYSAISLDESQKIAIAEKLSQRLDKTVRIINIVDETIVAGLIIRAGDLVIDNSVNSQLNRLNKILQS